MRIFFHSFFLFFSFFLDFLEKTSILFEYYYFSIMERIPRTEILYPIPRFDSELVWIIMKHESWSQWYLYGSTNSQIFLQMLRVLQMLESMRSARIEGNNTTIADYIETKIYTHTNSNDSSREIQNIEQAIQFIDKQSSFWEKDNTLVLDTHFVSELHKIVTQWLHLPYTGGEWDKTPGKYRVTEVKINHSNHIPPPAYLVEDYMQELFEEIHKEMSPQYYLLRIILLHHRFVWIHPFWNGNGRVGRLFTYAMLKKFYPHTAWFLNPTTLFAQNKNMYYDMLARADTYTQEWLLEWCEYVGKGIGQHMEKMDILQNFDHISKNILLPTLEHAQRNKKITNTQKQILLIALEKQVIQNADLRWLFPQKSAKTLISQEIRKMLDMNILTREYGNKRKYVICFSKGILLRSVIEVLREQKFIEESE